jgi:hypothetical protein
MGRDKTCAPTTIKSLQHFNLWYTHRESPKGSLTDCRGVREWGMEKPPFKSCWDRQRSPSCSGSTPTNEIGVAYPKTAKASRLWRFRMTESPRLLTRKHRTKDTLPRPRLFRGVDFILDSKIPSSNCQSKQASVSSAGESVIQHTTSPVLSQYPQ